MNDIVDMSQFVEAKSDQLNTDDLLGGPRTVTIRRVTGSDGDQPVSIFYEGDNNKPFKPCKTMRRILLAVWGRYASDYVGRSMTLYRYDSVTFGGLNVGGIRVSHMSHVDKDMVVVVMKTKGKKAGIKIQPLNVDAPKPAADRAASWATNFIEQINDAADFEAVMALEAKYAERLAELKEKRPELHSQIMDASKARMPVAETFDAETGEIDSEESF